MNIERIPSISVLLTAYNRQLYISESIESVIASTYQNWELIIVDDASTDETVSIAKTFTEKDPRVKLYMNEYNLGDYPNRNKAASLAKGKYIKYVDSDDTIYPETLQNMVSIMEQFPKAQWGLGSSLFYIDSAIYLDQKAAYEYHYFNKPVFFASPGMSIIKKDAFEAVRGFNENRMTSDFEMWHKLSDFSPLILIPGKIINIREHTDQEVQQQSQYVISYEKIKLKYITQIKSPLSKDQVRKIKKDRKKTTIKIAIKKLLSFEFKAAIPRLKVFWFYLWN
ncbi:MAG: glycosyltransferase family 2 protein [Ferruginibacter sp.]